MSRDCGLNRLGEARDSYFDFPLVWVRKSERVIPAAPQAISAISGLRYERKCLAALSRGDFLSSLAAMFSDQKGNATVALRSPNSGGITNNDLKIIKILHNPCFEYKLENKTNSQFCFPDILIEIGIAANRVVANQSAANLNLIPANLIPANQIPANQNPTVANPTPAKFIILIEVKLTWVPIAWEKLINLYLPIVAKFYSLPILPLVIVKNLTKTSPPSAANLTDALVSKFPLLYFPAQRFTTIS